MKLDAYSSRPKPLGSYFVIVTLFSGGTSLVLGILGRLGRGLPLRWSLSDILLLTVATHKLSRLLAKDRVTSFLRAPFASLEGPVGAGEVAETPRGEGPQKAIGELVTCPFCLSVWCAAVLGLLYGISPRLARFISVILAATAGSHFLHHGYILLREKNTD